MQSAATKASEKHVKKVMAQGDTPGKTTPGLCHSSGSKAKAMRPDRGGEAVYTLPGHTHRRHIPPLRRAGRYTSLDHQDAHQCVSLQ